MPKPDLDMPGLLPIEPAHVLLAEEHWLIDHAWSGRAVVIPLHNGRSAGALSCAAQRPVVAVEAEHP